MRKRNSCSKCGVRDKTIKFVGLLLRSYRDGIGGFQNANVKLCSSTFKTKKAGLADAMLMWTRGPIFTTPLKCLWSRNWTECGSYLPVPGKTTQTRLQRTLDRPLLLSLSLTRKQCYHYTLRAISPAAALNPASRDVCTASCVRPVSKTRQSGPSCIMRICKVGPVKHPN
jgi:hypothetical protein